MTTESDDKICWHINVTEVTPDGTTALFEFQCKHVDRDTEKVVDSTVKVWFPREVIQSWTISGPKMLADLDEFARQAKAKSGAKN